MKEGCSSFRSGSGCFRWGSGGVGLVIQVVVGSFRLSSRGCGWVQVWVGAKRQTLG